MKLHTCMVLTLRDNYDSLKEISVEQLMQVIVNRQFVAVPQDGGHTVEVGRRRHEEAILPRRSWWRASTRTNVSHWAAHLVGRHPWGVMDPLEKSLYPGGLKFRTHFDKCLILLRSCLVPNGGIYMQKHKHMTAKDDKESVRTHFTIRTWVCLENHLEGTQFLVGCYSYWGQLNDSFSQDKNWLLMYLSLVPASCVVPIRYRMSMVESDERPFSRPNRRGLFKSTERAAKNKIWMLSWEKHKVSQVRHF